MLCHSSRGSHARMCVGKLMLSNVHGAVMQLSHFCYLELRCLMHADSTKAGLNVLCCTALRRCCKWMTARRQRMTC